MDPIALIDKYYHEHPTVQEILLTHSTKVAQEALQIADRHPQYKVDRQFLEEAAMLHDIGIIFCYAPTIDCVGEHDYIEHGILGAELLRQEGLPKHAGVAEHHTGTGITMEQIIQEDLPLPLQDYCPKTNEEVLICYADKYYSKSHPEDRKSVEAIRRSLRRHGNDCVERFDYWLQLFG